MIHYSLHFMTDVFGPHATEQTVKISVEWSTCSLTLTYWQPAGSYNDLVFCLFFNLYSYSNLTFIGMIDTGVKHASALTDVWHNHTHF